IRQTSSNALQIMGEHHVEQNIDDRQQRAFMHALLSDLRALEVMLATDRIESGVRRIGAEQEMFLVDTSLRPAPVAGEVLKRVGDPRWAALRPHQRSRRSATLLRQHHAALVEHELSSSLTS